MSLRQFNYLFIQPNEGMKLLLVLGDDTRDTRQKNNNIRSKKIVLSHDQKNEKNKRNQNEQCNIK